MKCPFCTNPCGNEHCPYYEKKDEKNKELAGIKEENKRLKETIKQLQEFITNRSVTKL